MRLEASAWIQGDDRRRGFLSTQAVVVSRTCHRTTHEFIVLAQTVRQAGNGRNEELTGLVCLAGIEEVQPRVSAKGPIVVLARTIDPSEGLFMKQHRKAQFRSFLRCDLHEHGVVVARKRGLAVHRRHLVLSWCNLVVHHSHGHANPQHRCPDVL